MNIALLSKWGWDFLTRSYSYCLSFLQSKYLRNEGFRTAKSTHSDSPFWKVVLGSRDLLLKGACIQIGDGSTVNIWEDPWVPKCQDFKPKPRRPHQGACHVVKDLFACPGVWDTSKFRDLSNPMDANAVLALPLIFQPGKDKWIWTLAKSGKCSSRSACLTAQCHHFSIASTIPRMVWRCLWNAKILPRHKLLWWQFLSNCLPTRARLNRCIPDILTQCPLCNHSVEMALHLMTNYDIAKIIWFDSPWVIRSSLLNFVEPLDLFSFLWDLDCKDQQGNILLFAYIMLDFIWMSRNEATHGGLVPDPRSLCCKISKSYSESLGCWRREVQALVPWSPPPVIKIRKKV
ncbi:hypothetical protein UlMin_005334 [Ulmus minor]